MEGSMSQFLTDDEIASEFVVLLFHKLVILL